MIFRTAGQTVSDHQAMSNRHQATRVVSPCQLLLSEAEGLPIANCFCMIQVIF
jgi:hypothetical protein